MQPRSLCRRDMHDFTVFTVASCHMFGKDRRDRRKGVSLPVALRAWFVDIPQREVLGKRHKTHLQGSSNVTAGFVILSSEKLFREP